MRSVNQRIISSLKREDTNANRIKSGQERISGAMILKATSDDKSWILFSTIAISSDSDGQQSGGGSQIILSKLNLKRKQYYQRINRLTSLGLIDRKKGRYRITSFGRILYEIQKTVETAIQNKWKFVALDSLEYAESGEEMLVENRIKTSSVLLGDNDQIKNILLNQIGRS